jgi:hypothetical protein
LTWTGQASQATGRAQAIGARAGALARRESAFSRPKRTRELPGVPGVDVRIVADPTLRGRFSADGGPPGESGAR